MALRVVARMRGSKWGRVLPGGVHNEDLGRSNLWRPMVVDRTGGSR